MKWVASLATIFLMGCHSVTNEVLEVKQVVVSEAPKNTITWVKPHAIDTTYNAVTFY